jgi:hypothetical protein
MMYVTITLWIAMINGLLVSSSEAQSSSPVLDLLTKTLIRTFETPIAVSESSKEKFSVDIMLDNDVFNLDDALRLFIQQFLIALVNGRIDYLPDDWETRFPAYARVIRGVNGILDLLAERTLSQISMKDIRPFVKSKSFHLE